MSNMKILCTGSEGFIGSRLCIALEALGHTVLRYDRKLNSYMRDFKDVDLIYHMAAQTNVQYSMTHPYQDASDNILLTTQILENYPDVKIIYPMSASSLDIQSPYGLSKRVASEYIKLLHKEYTIILLPNIYGPGGFGVINKFEEAESLTIYGTGEATRTIVHVDDVVRAFILALDIPNGEYTLGGQVISVNEIAERFPGKPKTYVPEFKGEIFSSVVENTVPGWEQTILF